MSRVALVTGGSRGIGRAIAIALGHAGADVAVNYRKRFDEAASVVRAVEAAGRRSIAIAADVSQGLDVRRLFDETNAALGPVDILVNNAGVGLHRTLDDLTEADFDVTIAVNLKSAFLCMQAAVPHMRAQKWGRIVNITSGAARGAGSVGPHYNASKAGMEGLTRGYAARLVAQGVTVNAVAPSLIATDMIASRAEELSKKIPLGRLGTAEECADAVLMVVANAYMTGQTIHLNGGMNFN
jgi:3-oxoacyl-[acyl-carrier protein] reductase